MVRSRPFVWQRSMNQWAKKMRKMKMNKNKEGKKENHKREESIKTKKRRN